MSNPADRNDEPGGAQVLVQRVWLQGRLLTAIATILILALAGYAIFHLTSEVRYEDVMSALDKTSATAIALAARSLARVRDRATAWCFIVIIAPPKDEVVRT